MSRQLGRFILGIALLAGVSSAARAVVIDGVYDGDAVVWMKSGDFEITMPYYQDYQTGYYHVGTRDDAGNIIPYTYTNAEFEVTLDAVLDPDPSITYGLSVTDFGAPSSFLFVFTTPIVATGPSTTVTGFVSGALTDLTGNGVTITPTIGDTDGDGLPEIQMNELLSGAVNMGVDVGLAATFSGPAATTYTYGGYSAGPAAGPAGIWTGLQSTVAFSLSGSGDVASLSGFASVVPEPSTFALVGIAAASLLGRCIIRRRRAGVCRQEA